MRGNGLQVTGRWRWEIWTPGGDCRKLGQFHNGIVTVGINALLDAYFNAGTQPAGFYVGPIDDDDYDELSADDTMASHAGWTEMTDYSEATRPAWDPSAAASGLLVASSASEITLSAGKTLKGLFLTSDNTKGGTAGTLWATGLFDVVQVMQASEVFKCYYELEARAG